MAGDWIKMRSDLYRDPKVCVMADLLMDPESELSAFVNQQTQRDMTVTRNVMRNVTVGALLSVWGVMRTRGKRENSDLIVKGCSVSVVDDIADLPGFGAAMESVGWVHQDHGTLVFPRFFEDHNVDPSEKFKEANAERQRRFREKNDAKKSNVTVTLHNATEKRREEKSILPDTSGRAPVSLEVAIAYGLTIGCLEETTRTWYETRSRDGWMIHGGNGVPRPIMMWQSDLATARSWRSSQKPPAANDHRKDKAAREYPEPTPTKLPRIA